ncbi:MAG: GNAT family N-acetyltransferase [Chthoniobacterales bacterium]|nr:GNAT family N-acetyltransferase [Chthoniobacterales bacterium]
MKTNQSNPPADEISIKMDNLRGPEIAALLEEHLEDMIAASPPESRHVLDLEGLRRPDISFWCAWQGPTLLGCGALKELDARHAEIKSMRTARNQRGKGVGTRILERLIAEARRRDYRRLSLETGSMEFFAPARRLYGKFGFALCAPFASYKNDPNSVFMTMEL